MTKAKVAFICTHNSCRSQIAEALGRKLAGDVFESYSAGTDLKDQINPDAVRLLEEHYGIDMLANGQKTKTLADLPAVDYVVTMGCGVHCPYLPAKKRVDWGLEDPTGLDDDSFMQVIKEIEDKVLELKQEVNGLW
ncbi:ArsC family transcriptional regulator [Lactobacillus nasalidis]|uniref:ArsC family transcriptional regulator n=1 Tax=Lactobacillus nasalidis TaxID=2797258 RepID=A0ABQ3W9H0_9LACO|nr:arsenate reductase ArsC [Lactobacillus nasalidis]GHV98278.1 ArsC family transcriptional regulator [Lactobacillus nasalidis]GHV99403.1 ArsC family transcriptional regulator [Lactobacillus nasalidis]GHW01979.1 ArsC family transcriptional regulator [Lactobacillus nasalidis]